MKKEIGSKYYGVTGIKKNDNQQSIYEEYSRDSLDKICDIPEKEFGHEKLKKINEQDLVKCPFI